MFPYKARVYKAVVFSNLDEPCSRTSGMQNTESVLFIWVYMRVPFFLSTLEVYVMKLYDETTHCCNEGATRLSSVLPLGRHLNPPCRKSRPHVTSTHVNLFSLNMHSVWACSLNKIRAMRFSSYPAVHFYAEILAFVRPVSELFNSQPLRHESERA